MKTYFLTLLLFVFISVFTLPQNKNVLISELKNNEVIIKLHKFIEFNSQNNKNKFLVADITIDNISGKSIAMGSDYTMGITIKDATGKEYRSGLKGAGIVASYLAKHGNDEQDQKAYNLCFSDNFPPKTKVRSLLCGFEVPQDAKIVSFGIKKKNLWDSVK
jgi:hypothetical protein